MGGVLGMPYFIAQYTNKQLYDGISAQTLQPDFALPAWEKSLMTSILSAGTFFGALAGVSCSLSFKPCHVDLKRVILPTSLVASLQISSVPLSFA